MLRAGVFACLATVAFVGSKLLISGGNATSAVTQRDADSPAPQSSIQEARNTPKPIEQPQRRTTPYQRGDACRKVKARLTREFGEYSFEEGESENGVAVRLNKNWAYWVEGDMIFAINKLSAQAIGGTPDAPKHITWSTIDSAITMSMMNSSLKCDKETPFDVKLYGPMLYSLQFPLMSYDDFNSFLEYLEKCTGIPRTVLEGKPIIELSKLTELHNNGILQDSRKTIPQIKTSSPVTYPDLYRHALIVKNNNLGLFPNFDELQFLTKLRQNLDK